MNIRIPEALLEALQRRAALDEISVDEAHRRALWLFTYARDRMDEKDAELLLVYDGQEEDEEVQERLTLTVSGAGGGGGGGGGGH